MGRFDYAEDASQLADTESSPRNGRFNHHPDPAIDFEVECDCLMGLAFDAEHGMADKAAVIERMARALEFRVGGVPSCINAKEALRERFNSLNFDNQ
jgi:hypothetical protein